jgi:hypothetical protein
MTGAKRQGCRKSYTYTQRHSPLGGKGDTDQGVNSKSEPLLNDMKTTNISIACELGALSDIELRQAQERLLSALWIRPSLWRSIEPRSGIGKRHFPSKYWTALDVVASEPHRIREISERGDHEYRDILSLVVRQPVALMHTQAIDLAKQIVRSIVQTKTRRSGEGDQAHEAPQDGAPA